MDSEEEDNYLEKKETNKLENNKDSLDVSFIEKVILLTDNT